MNQTKITDYYRSIKSEWRRLRPYQEPLSRIIDLDDNECSSCHSNKRTDMYEFCLHCYKYICRECIYLSCIYIDGIKDTWRAHCEECMWLIHYGNESYDLDRLKKTIQRS